VLCVADSQPEPLCDFAAAIVGDLWVVVGGTDPSQTDTCMTVRTLDLSTWVWDEVPVGRGVGLRGPALTPRSGHVLLPTADQRLLVVSGMGMDEGTVAAVERLSLPKGRARRNSTHVGATARAMQVEHPHPNPFDKAPGMSPNPGVVDQRVTETGVTT
jgi:hypothetical protein